MSEQLKESRPGGLEMLSLSDQRHAASVPRPAFAWKTRVALPAMIGLITLALLAYAARDVLLPAVDVRVVPVVLKDRGGAGPSDIQAPGWVEPEPYAIAVSALADGVVKEVLALEGQPVKAGQVVARLVDDDARLAVDKARAELAQRQAALVAAESLWDNPVERTRALSFAEGAVAETQAQLVQLLAEVSAESARDAELRDQLARSQQQFDQNAATERELIEARLRVAGQEATLQATQARKPILEAQLKQRQADLTAARENLRLRIDEKRTLAESKAAVALAQASLDEAKLRLDRMQVRANVDGVVMARLVEPGDKLVLVMDSPRSAQAVKIYDPSHLQVRVDVPLASAAGVGVGQDAKIVVGVLPDQTFTGKVTRIVHEADIQKNTLQVKVSIANPSSQLKPEMLARVKFAAGASAGAGEGLIFAPEDLLIREGDATATWVVDAARQVATRRTVRTGGVRERGWIAIESGLQPGDQLIAGDTSHLRDGQRVRVVGEAQEGAGHGAH